MLLVYLWISAISSLACAGGTANLIDRYRSAWSADTNVFWDATKAKGLLNSVTRSSRHRRGWGSFVHGLTNGEENKERAEESMEHDRLMLHITRSVFCRSKCWSAWAAWSSCSKPCNGGQQERTRQVSKPTQPTDCTSFPCPGSNTHIRKCHLKCGPGGTDNQKGKCDCRDGYSGQCCATSVKCPKVAKPANGNLDGAIGDATYKAGLIYTCNAGFVLTGGPEVRICQLNGQWSGVGGHCTRVICDGLAIPDFGSQQVDPQDQYYYGGSVGFSCDSGYDLQGSKVRTCRVYNNGTTYWSGFQPTCLEKVCGDPGTPRNGQKIGDGTFFDDHVRFTCNTGYTMIGSSERTCSHTAHWNGTQPICQPITCTPLEPPRDGTLRFDVNRGRVMGSLVTIECRSGFELKGSKSIECQENGRWNGTVPQCEAIECPDPGRPEHGSRLDSGFSFRSRIVYSCFDGYVLWGSAESQCLRSRVWSEAVPICKACPKDHYSYKLSNGEKQCLPCPENTHTASNASYSASQCICNSRYAKNADGECKEIFCSPLSVPSGGVLYPCENTVGSMCITECINGHVLGTGASVRYCMANGLWSGLDVVCAACPKNTFRGGPANCFPCPMHMHTEGTGSSFHQCLCDEGFSSPAGGMCLDIDECAVGTEQCEDICHNTYGGYACECSRPGVVVDIDGLRCKVENECRNLTQTDAPLNGGLTCKWYTEQSSVFCRVMCNNGYELPPETNAFETCGPTTEYLWSFKKIDIDNTLLPCIDEYFPGYKIYGETSYFVRACQDLTEPEKDEVKANFAALLNTQNVCQHGRSKLCDVSDMGIICGATSRKRRSADGEVEEDTIEIKVTLQSPQAIKKAVDCSRFCPRFRLVGANCEKYCTKSYNRRMRAGMIYAQRKLKSVASRASTLLTFDAAGRHFQNPREAKVSSVEADCPDATITSNSMCVPCGPGTYFSESGPDGTPTCILCPAGQFQPEYLQHQCLHCPAGTNSTEGANVCQPCDDDHYGIQCQHECQCVNGDCDPADGSCDCHAGWEGLQCQTDIDGCTADPCFQGGPCTDLEAPQTGFECGQCPQEYIGDGIVCEETI